MAQLPESAPESTAALLAGYVHAAGVRHVFGYPGESVIDFMEAARHRGVEVVSAVREGTAAFMAEAAEAVTGLPGVCLSTLGPGSTAVLNGVAAATLDRVPMLAVSVMATPMEHRGRSPRALNCAGESVNRHCRPA